MQVLYFWRNNPMHQRGWRPTCWKATLPKSTWESWFSSSRTGVSHVLLEQRSILGCIGKSVPRLEVIIFLLITCETVSEGPCLSFALSTKRRMLEYRDKSIKGLWRWLEPEIPEVQREFEGIKPAQPEEKSKGRFYGVYKYVVGR